ncbi:unnamed protein product [Ilex paraguariensis]|uniref:CTLH domain-containing protein n=1 Tax=Ilex paraguariensis TaxID=185542 RepID=A0ABC8V4E2_9AQUA
MVAMSLHKELIFLILQFCDEEELKQTAHMLQHETGIFFDMKYFEDLLLGGNWDEAERYLSGFSGVEEDKYSIKVYFEIRKQKFLEALDKHDTAKALDILVKDLKVFAPSNEELYKEMTHLLTLDDFRKHSSLSTYGDMMSARIRMMNEVKNVLEASPLFHDKLKFPDINKSRLRRLINQSLNWQHVLCTYPQPDPSIKTLFMDHQCPLPDQPCDHSIEINPLLSNDPSTTSSPFSGKSNCDPSTVTQSIVSDGDLNLGVSTNLDTNLKDGKDSDDMFKIRSTGTSEELTSPITFPSQSHSSALHIPDDLPKAVGRILNLGSSPTSMDFHPIQQTFILVGTNVGDIELWEVISGEKLLSRKFRVWKIDEISVTFLENLVKDPCVSVNRILWSPDGSLFGVAYSKHIVQLYSYHGGRKIRNQLEVDAHVGGVNDLAFSKPNKQLLLITCGDDKLVQVWDVISGAKQYTFEGHGAPVYTVCPHVKETIHFIFSTSTNGEIKAWLYDNMGSRVAYDTPGHCCMRMAYGADGKRDGVSYIVEWDQTEGYLMRTYVGLHKCSAGVVQFDTSKNRFLAAGDDHLIKVWDVDNCELLTTIDADGDLPASPYIRFNKKGTFLAVFANYNRIKILANCHGLQLLQMSEDCPTNAFTALSETLVSISISTAAESRLTDKAVPVKGDTETLEDGQPGSTAAPADILETRNLSKIHAPSQLQSLRLPSEVKISKVCGIFKLSQKTSYL